MKRNFTRVDRVAQMTMQEELIAKKKLEILEKQRTKEIGKQVAAAQKNVATTTCVSITKDVEEGEEKQVIEAEIASPSPPAIATHPLIAAANIPKLQNNFCNDGSFFEHYKKVIEQTKKDEEAKKQAEAKLKIDINNVTEDEVKQENEIQSELFSENAIDVNGQKNVEIKTEMVNCKEEDDEVVNNKGEINSNKYEEQEIIKADEVKTEITDNTNYNSQEPLITTINSSNQPIIQPSPYSDSLNQFNIKTENQHFNHNFSSNPNTSSIPVTTRQSFLQGPYSTQLTSQSNAMSIHIPQTFNMPPNTTFNLSLPPPMINFTIQQPTPPPPPPPVPVLLPLPQPAPNLFQNSYSNPSIFLMQHQTPPQISIPYQQQTQQMSMPHQQQQQQQHQQQPPPTVSILQTAPLQQMQQAQQVQNVSQPSPLVTLQCTSELNQIAQASPPQVAAQSFQQFQQQSSTIETQRSSPITTTEDSQDNLTLQNDNDDIKDAIKSSSNSEHQSSYQSSSRSNTNSPIIIQKDHTIKNTVFSEDSKQRVDQTKSSLPTSLQSCIDMVAENGDAFEDYIRSKKDEVHSSLWFLFDMESDEYGIYRQGIVKAREEIRNRKRNAIYNSNDEKYDPESVCDDRCDNDSDDEYMKGMLNRNTNNLKRRIESRVEIEEEERLQAAEEERQQKRKSRWGGKIDSNTLPTVTAVVQTSFANQNKPMLSGIQRTDPALLQYAKLNYGGINLSEEDWNKCEEHFKVNLLYQDMMKKRREIDQLAKSGKFKYEYDSDEDVEGGTWEHKLRMAEMEATNAWALALTKQSEGKHHIGDFLPPEELKKFMEQYEAKKNNRQPDLSDYKEFKLKEDNKGFQMLQKLGWQEGQGLGAGGDGIVDPINKATQREANQGLGANSASIPNDGDNEYEAYRKRMMLAYRFRPNPLNNPRRAYY